MKTRSKDQNKRPADATEGFQSHATGNPVDSGLPMPERAEDGAVKTDTPPKHQQHTERRTIWSPPERQSFRYFHSLIEASLDPLVTISPDGKITEINAATEEITGVARCDLIGSNFADYFTDPAKAQEAYQQVFAQGFITDYSLAFRHTTGKITDVLYNARVYPDDAGNVVGVFAAARDITVIKRQEEALRESEQHYRTIADSTSDCDYWILPDGSLRYISPSCEQITGYTTEEFYTDPQLLTRIIIHPADRLLYTGHSNHMSDRGVPRPIYFRIKTKGGQYRRIAHVCRQVYDSAGNPAGLRGSNRDDTERWNMDEQVRQFAFYDVLTQLPNRRLLIDRLDQAMIAGKRSGRYGAVIYLDLDNFKPLNDRHGHEMGDLLLVEVGRRLRSCLREVDTAARFGGDEFVVLLGDLMADKSESTVQAGVIAEKIRNKLAEPYFMNREKDGKSRTIEHQCSASIGVVVFGNQEKSHEDILQCADAAMYQAKEGGRNVIRFHEAVA